MKFDLVAEDLVVKNPQQMDPLFKLRSLQIERGARILIHGPSGKGKTTLLHLLAGQFLPDEGVIRVMGQAINSLNADARCRLRRKHFGIVFQRCNLIDHYTVLENVALDLNKPDASFKQKFEAVLQQLGLLNKAKQLARTLSPGEQQRVAVARILLARPDIILADEPTSNLDYDNAQTVIQALCEAAFDRTLLVVSHDQRIHGYFTSVLDFSKITQC